MITASQSAVASLQIQAPVRRFMQYEAASQAMAAYEAALCENASRRRSNGLSVTDQDQPDEAFCLFPERPLHPPLAIIGGMGALAGAMAFRRACARFRSSRTVVLYQACSVPDRSTVILGRADDSPGTSMSRDVAARLAGAVRLAVGLAGPPDEPVRCILACNSAHYFWRLLQDDLRQNAAERHCEVQMVSLVESALKALKYQSCRKALLLATEGARVGQVFSVPFHHAGVAFEEPPPTEERLLMRAIFEGVKSLDNRRALQLGNEFFENILRTRQDYDCVVAGCTEVPLMIDLLRLRGNRVVAAFLSRVKIIDPVEEALCRV